MNDKELSENLPARIMRIGGITNILFSPVCILFYWFFDPLEGRDIWKGGL